MKKFDMPEMEIITFNSSEVIATSGCGKKDDGCNCDAYVACTPVDEYYRD